MSHDERRSPPTPSPAPPNFVPNDDLAKLLSPVLSAPEDAFPEDGSPLPSVEDTLQFRLDETPEWWPTTEDLRQQEGLTRWGRASWNSPAERRLTLFTRLKENLPTSSTTPATKPAPSAVVVSLRRTYAGLLSEASGILNK